MDLEQQIRQEHPDWTDEQVQAEVTRRQQAPPPPPPPPAPTPPAPPEPDSAAYAEMRRKLKAAEDEAQRLRDEEAERQRTAAEQQGEYQKLYEQEKARADGLQEQIDSDKETRRTTQLVGQVAEELKFKRSDEALALLPADVDRSDKEAVRKALEGLATERPHLVDKKSPPPSGKPPGGPGGPDPDADLTLEQLQGMTASQIAALPKEKVDKALASAT